MLCTTRLRDTTSYDICHLHRPYHWTIHSIPQFIAGSLSTRILIHAGNRDYGCIHESLGLHVSYPRIISFPDDFHRARNCFMEFAPGITCDKIPPRSYRRRIMRIQSNFKFDFKKLPLKLKIELIWLLILEVIF